MPLHPEAFERIDVWLDAAGIREQRIGPQFPPARTARGGGRHGFANRPMTRRAFQALIKRSVQDLRLDHNGSLRSRRTTALTTERERGSDIIDLQDFTGHAEPRTTLTSIRNSNRLSRSPAYV